MAKKNIFKNFSQAELDWQYNNRKRVPEVESLYKRWVEPSSGIIEQYETFLDIPYGNSDREILDIILPRTSGPYAVNLYLHGGYWMSRTKSDQTFLAKPILDSGAVFAAVEYDLIPNVRMADIVRQCRNAVSWIFKNAERFNIDINQVYVSGHSAGAHLASILISTDWDTIDGYSNILLRGACLISGIYDLRPVKLSYMQDILNFSNEEVRNFSPARFKLSFSGPVIVAVGSEESEEFCRQSSDLVNEWSVQGINCSYLELNGCNHFDILENFANLDGLLSKKIIEQMSLA